MEANQPGANVDIQDRLEAFLEAEESPPVAAETPQEPVEKQEAKTAAVEAETVEEQDVQEAVETVELDADTLAAAFGIEHDQLLIDEEGKLSFTTKVHGEESQANLADLLKSYQLDSVVNKRSTELGEQRKAFEAEAAQAREALGQQLQQADYLLKTMEGQLLGEYQQTNWDQLRVDDPAEYSARQQDFQQRSQHIEQLKQQALNAAVQQSQWQQQTQAQNLQAYAIQQQELTLDALPTWNDESTRQKEQAEISEYLQSQGYKPEELNSMIDHRHLLTARKAMLWDKSQKSVATTEKQLKKVAKPVLKPGASKTKAERKQANLSKQREKLRRSSGSTKDVAAYLENIL